jgi:hypothetical protein
MNIESVVAITGVLDVLAILGGGWFALYLWERKMEKTP